MLRAPNTVHKVGPYQGPGDSKRPLTKITNVLPLKAEMIIKHVSTTEYNGKEVRIIRMTGRWDSVIGYRFNVKNFP